MKYEEILEFFIAWLRKNPSPEFAGWVWDSRRSLAIKGADEDFRRGMVAAYKRMTECMSDNGIQVIMFTHQSGSIWADMANIVWASGLQVTAAWYVVTETDSALREGSYVKGGAPRPAQALRPTVIVEVLSPSTEVFDRGDKLHRYRRWLPTLTDYVLVAQDRPVIDHYQHTPTGRWELETLEGLDVHLHLTSIGCTVPLADVYERIVFPQAEEDPTPRAREE